jgi:predicted transcriptional regulator
MADTLTIQINPDTAAGLRRMAEDSGETVEQLAQRLLADAAQYSSQLSDEQLADLEERLKNPGPLATDEEVEAFFSRFKA